MTRDKLQLLPALAAGAVAIDVNTALLTLSDALGLPTAHGGLLRFLQMWGAPLPSGLVFATGFHIAVGLAMAVVYAAVAPWTRLRPLAAGLGSALLVWLFNSAVVLPAIGEGFAGSRHLGLAGMTMFAAIHTVFFVLLALWEARLRAPIDQSGRSF